MRLPIQVVRRVSKLGLVFSLSLGIVDVANPQNAPLSTPFADAGLELRADDGRVAVATVVPGGPAAILSPLELSFGDFICAIDGHSTKEMPLERAAELLRGPVGTSVELKTLSWFAHGTCDDPMRDSRSGTAITDPSANDKMRVFHITRAPHVQPPTRQPGSLVTDLVRSSMALVETMKMAARAVNWWDSLLMSFSSSAESRQPAHGSDDGPAILDNTVECEDSAPLQRTAGPGVAARSGSVRPLCVNDIIQSPDPSIVDVGGDGDLAIRAPGVAPCRVSPPVASPHIGLADADCAQEKWNRAVKAKVAALPAK